MPHPRTVTRGALALLLEAGKLRAGIEWSQVEREIGLRKSTRESWMRGRVANPPLVGVLALADYLGVLALEVSEAALKGTLPAWAEAQLVRSFAPHAVVERLVIAPPATTWIGSNRAGVRLSADGAEIDETLDDLAERRVSRGNGARRRRSDASPSRER